MSLSAFGVEDGRISKAEGDKKKTKYALSGLAGYSAGGQIGSRAGARAGGTTLRRLREDQIGAGLRAAGNGGGYRATATAVGGVKGAKAAMRGGIGGAVAGGVLGAGSYALHRRNRSDAG